MVADGMGGHQGGNVASHIVSHYLPNALLKQQIFLQRSPKALLARFLTTQVQKTSAKVHRMGLENRHLTGMGSTLIMALARPPWVVIANVGDSRAYLIRYGAMMQISDDHSTVNGMIKRGEITAQQARVHPARHIITRFIGMGAHTKTDLGLLYLRKGDRLLLCSDGLTDMLEDGTIVQIANESRSAQQAVSQLVEAAKAAGGVDNITVVIADYHGI